MNSSSGIKRGLAASAVAALAVAGIPALASSASATAGETISVASVGPTLNGGDVGGLIRLKASATVVANDVNGTTSSLQVTNTTLNGSPNNGNQNVAIVGTPTWIANGAAGDSNKTDGLNEVLVNVAATTSDVGATASYAIYIDDDGDNVDGVGVDASEARTQVTQQTSGPAATVGVAPSAQSAAAGQSSGAYTATLLDAQGRTTQLMSGEDVAVTTDSAALTPSDISLGADDDLVDGVASFTVATTLAATLGNHTITLDTSLPATVPNATATLTVTKAATITAPEVDIVTAADDWDGFGGGTAGGTTAVRVDQGSIRMDFKSADPVNDANSTVTLTLGGGDVTFGGQPTTTVSTVLDANGVGSITITPDAFTVQEGDQLTVTGSFAQTFDFERAQATQVKPGADPYFSALKGSVDVSATILDQFGNPVTSGFVGAQRMGPANTDTSPQTKAVGANGTVTFTFTDAHATAGQVDTVGLGWVPDQFTPPGSALPGVTHIKYTVTGQGADFNTSLEGISTGSGTYKPSDVSVIPLADTAVSAANEAADLAIAGAEINQGVTVSVDNGALILKPGQTLLSQGSASVTATTDGAGNLPAGYQIIGTKSGITTVTVSSANRTETAQFTVAGQTDVSKARNVAVSGPAEVESGTTQITFTTVVTDAFGNPIPNIPVTGLNIQVTGPAQFQDSDAMTNAQGQLNLNVRVDSDAQGTVGIKVTGLANGNQFGAAANRLTAASATNDGIGLAVSSNVANASTEVTAPEPGKVDPQLALSGKSASGKDKVKANAIPEAAGATATLWVGGVKKKTGTLNASGDFTFSIKDTNGSKPTKYLVKVSGTGLTTKAKASISQK